MYKLFVLTCMCVNVCVCLFVCVCLRMCDKSNNLNTFVLNCNCLMSFKHSYGPFCILSAHMSFSLFVINNDCIKCSPTDVWIICMLLCSQTHTCKFPKKKKGKR